MSCESREARRRLETRVERSLQFVRAGHEAGKYSAQDVRDFERHTRKTLSWRLPRCLQLVPVEVFGLALQVLPHNLIRLFLPARRDRSDPPMQDALLDSFLANQKRGSPNRLDRHGCLRHSDVGALLLPQGGDDLV